MTESRDEELLYVAVAVAFVFVRTASVLLVSS